MRKIQEVLRLKWEGGLSNRAIAESCGIGETTVREYLRRGVRAGLSWPLPEGMDEAGLQKLLFSEPLSQAPPKRPTPSWQEIHQELKHKGVTLFLLWQEYKQAHPDGYQYSQFCEHYRRWSGTLDVWMRQTHKADEKMFVDYAGQTMPVVRESTGEVRQAQIFVAALGARNSFSSENTSRPDPSRESVGRHLCTQKWLRTNSATALSRIHTVAAPQNMQDHRINGKRIRC